MIAGPFPVPPDAPMLTRVIDGKEVCIMRVPLASPGTWWRIDRRVLENYAVSRWFLSVVYREQHAQADGVPE